MKESVICAVQHSSMGVFRSALHGETGRSTSLTFLIHYVLFLIYIYIASGILCAKVSERAQGYF